MKEITVTHTEYHCEICGSVFDKKENAINHEKKHCNEILRAYIPDKLDYYAAHTHDRDKGIRGIYPNEINVDFGDGKTVSYIMLDSDELYRNK